MMAWENAWPHFVWCHPTLSYLVYKRRTETELIFWFLDFETEIRLIYLNVSNGKTTYLKVITLLLVSKLVHLNF